MLLYSERLRHCILQLVSDRSQCRGIVNVLDDDHELVAAQARQQVDLAQRRRECRRHGLEKLVADPVSQRVVDILETVEVDEQHADPTAGALRMRDRLCQALLQQQPVGQTGQRVARCHVLQALLGPDPRRHVLRERQDRCDATVVIEQTGVVPLAPDDLAILAVVSGQTRCPGFVALHQ